MPLTFGSLFDGIGAFSLGLRRAGLVQKWACEIEADCRRVTAARFPGLRQHVDVRDCGRRDTAVARAARNSGLALLAKRVRTPADCLQAARDGVLEPVDVIVGGWPCQDLSVAGKRGGLAGKKSGLFYEMTRIIDEFQPRYVVGENVPGLFNSDRGRDFARVLLEMDRIGFHGAWTVLDAQWFGVAQRRRRIFLVFARRDIAAERTAEILALQHRSGRHPTPRSQAESSVAGTLGGGTAGRGWSDDLDRAGTFAPERAATLRSRSAVGLGVNAPGRGGEDDVNLVVAAAFGGGNCSGEIDVATSVSTRSQRNDFHSDTFVVFGELGEGRQSYQEVNRAMPLRTSSGGGGTMQNLVAGTIQAHSKAHGHAMGTQQAAESGQLVVEPTAFNIVGLGQQGKNHAYEASVTGAVQHKGNSASGNEAGTVVVTATAFQERGREGGRVLDSQEDLAYSLNAPSGGRRHEMNVQHGMIVRRLMPVECLRLQGLPDDHLDVEPPLSDSAKYRMIGNAGVPRILEWIGARMRKVEEAGE